MHKCYNYTKIKKGEPNLEKLKNCLDKWGIIVLPYVLQIYLLFHFDYYYLTNQQIEVRIFPHLMNIFIIAVFRSNVPFEANVFQIYIEV